MFKTEADGGWRMADGQILSACRGALIAVAVVGCAQLFAAEPAPAPKPAETAPAKSADTKPAEAKVEPKADEKTDERSASAVKDEEKAPPAKSPAEQKATPQRFIPSEQVRADFDVSFPIDI